MLKKVGRYLQNLLLSLDQLGNVILGGAPDETISARSGRKREKSAPARVMCSILDTIDKGHCADAVESEKQHKHHPKFYQHRDTGDEKEEAA
jgi:hypothetical protein